MILSLNKAMFVAKVPACLDMMAIGTVCTVWQISIWLHTSNSFGIRLWHIYSIQEA